MSLIHTFAGNPLDRADVQRRDADWLAAAARSFSSRFLPFADLNVLLNGNALGWVSAMEIEAAANGAEPVLLGLDGEVAHFAVDVSGDGDPLARLGLGGGWRFEDCRMAAMRMAAADTGIVAQARAQLGWHDRHRHCSVCGAPTAIAKGGHVRQCGTCGAEHFPRTDPVVIMLVTDGDRCLLGQPHGPLVRTGMYSALAGFMDQGESIEEAVRREVLEEAGLTVGAVSYHSSQPWPFPSSLMIGCHGKALSTDIRIDPEEMADVRWFERGEVVRALDGASASLKVPGAIAIAHHLIKDWALG
ncbi:MAG: NAD(+) diphosphatase [Gammaproteobacteria bacterium]|nr:NAD(+) diphosphatase [Gammaproteobacteria bacterium]